ncbi:Thymidylate kinase, partial [Fragariocoptes setiger]
MCELLKQGTTLIVDRYSYSGIAYSVAKNTQGLTYEWCRSSEIGLPRPDMIVFLTLGSEAQKARVGFGGERYEETSFQERVANCYTRLRQTEADRWLDVNVEGKSPKQLLEEIIVPVMNCIECNGHKQLSIIEQN